MRELITIYLPAAVVAVFISGFLGRFCGYKRLLYVGIYCLVVPIFAAFVFGELGRWSVVVSNSAGLVLLVLVFWLSQRKRVAADRDAIGEVVAE